MEATGEKKSTSWVDRWKARRQLRTVDREREAREKALRDRGEWGYIPPGRALVSKTTLWLISACLILVLVSNVVILWGQVRIYWQPRWAASVQAKAPGKQQLQQTRQQLPQPKSKGLSTKSGAPLFATAGASAPW